MKQEHQNPQGDLAVSNDAGRSRYEIRLDGQQAGFAEYRIEGDAVRFTHTKVEPRYEGQGIGSRLAHEALEDVRRRGLKAVPQCRFIAQYIARHEQEFGDLVAE